MRVRGLGEAVSEPTLSEQITAVDCASPWTPEHREALDAAARTLRLISNHAAVDETLRQIVDLELMQAQEQSKGGDSTENVNRSGNRLATDANAVAGDAHPHKHAQAADPPPPEDALLATLDHEIGAQHSVSYLWELLAQCREWIAVNTGWLKLCREDAGRLLRQIHEQADAIAAAEARAQGLEADARRYRWLREQAATISPQASTVFRNDGGWANVWDGPSLDNAIDKRAALARPEPEEK